MTKHEHHRSGRALWRFVAGFVIAALLALGAAVGASIWQQNHADEELTSDTPVAQG